MPAFTPEALLAFQAVAAPRPAAVRPFACLARFVARLAAAEQRRHDMERLETMPDYLLADIGLTRADLRASGAGARLVSGR